MRESEPACVQHLARRRNSRPRPVSSSVHGVADDGMARRGKVHTNLVRSASLELDGDERRESQPLENAIASHRALSLLAAAGDAASPVPGIAHEVGVEGAATLEVSFDQRHILSLDAVIVKEVLKKMQRLPIAGEDERARGVAIEPVDDESHRPAPVAMVQVIKHTGEERVRFPLGRGHGEKAGGFVDDQEILVFDEHGQT
jgi:hypothetical protein